MTKLSLENRSNPQQQFANIQLERVVISLGSNLGNRKSNLIWALQQLAKDARIKIVAIAKFIASADYYRLHPYYLNTVVIITTRLSPEQLWELLLQLERRRGRNPYRGYKASRHLDLDICFYGQQIISTARLTIPHPRCWQRLFVLAPLAELEPLWPNPHSGESCKRRLIRLSRQRPWPFTRRPAGKLEKVWLPQKNNPCDRQYPDNRP